MPENPRDPVREVGDGREVLEVEAFTEFARLLAEGRPAALVTLVGSTGSAPRGPGAAMTVREDGGVAGTVGGGGLEHEAVRIALEAIADGRTRRIAFDFTKGPERNLDMACAGTAELFVLPSGGGPELLLCGAGHVARALAPMARSAGYRITVFDDRPGYPRREDFGEGVRLVPGPYAETLPGARYDESRTFVVIVTHAHARDAEVLGVCLRRPTRYLGMIGSRAKVGQVYREVGADDEARERLARVRAPIGLDLGGRSPGEIAVSILAEMQAVRHGRERIDSMCKPREDN